MSTELEKREHKIRALLAQLPTLGPLRPGTLSVQYRHPQEKKTPFHQLSYTHKGQSRSDYVRPESLAAIRREVATYRRFRLLVAQVIALSLEASRLRHKKSVPPRTSAGGRQPRPAGQ